VDNSPNNSHYGKINVVDADSSSCSEMAVALISGLGLPVDQDVANNLYLGLKESTGNFTTGNVGADTFEAASLCLRWGAKGPTGAVIQKPVFGKTQIQPKSRQPQPGKFMGGSPKPPPQDNSAPSPDWLEPKIFKSSNIS
jgi:hypothetical protein